MLQVHHPALHARRAVVVRKYGPLGLLRKKVAQLSPIILPYIRDIECVVIWRTQLNRL